MATSSANTSNEPGWLARLIRAEPRAPMMFPYLVYLLILAFQDRFPATAWPVFMAIHVVLVAWVCWLFRRHYPPLGRAHYAIAALVGMAAAAWWVVGQFGFDRINIGGYCLGDRLLLYPGQAKVYNPHSDFSQGPAFGVYAFMKIFRAVTVVPFVEELLWRGFLLRAFISWDHFEQVPWAQFSWRAFIGTALLSTVQHPDNWGVSIGCWLLFNLLFYWKKSLWCVILTHAVTNLVLYGYVLWTGDWRFW